MVETSSLGQLRHPPRHEFGLRKIDAALQDIERLVFSRAFSVTELGS